MLVNPSAYHHHSLLAEPSFVPREEALNAGGTTHLHSIAENFGSFIQARNFKVTVETEIWICLYHCQFPTLWVGVRWLDNTLHANLFFHIGCRYAMPMLH